MNTTPTTVVNVVRRALDRTWADRRNRVGWLYATAAATRSFQPSLQARSATDQGMVTGLSLAVGFGAGRLGRTAIGSTNRLFGGTSRGPAPIAALAVGSLGFLADRALASGEQSLARATTRTVAAQLAAVGAVAAVLDGSELLVGSTRERHDRRMLLALAIGAGSVGVAAARWIRRERLAWREAARTTARTATRIALTTALSLTAEQVAATAITSMLRRSIPSVPARFPQIGHVAVAVAVADLAARSYRHVQASIATMAHEIEPGFADPPTSPFVSAGPGSSIRHAELGRHGRRFVVEVPARDEISAVLGEPARDPIRVYVGEWCGPDLDAQVRLAIEELERTHAFDRRWIIVACPTGSGLVDFAAIESLEFLTAGDVATVVVQYSGLLSGLALHRVGPASAAYRRLIGELRARIDATSPAPGRSTERPATKLGVFGLSLGAWITQEVFVGGGHTGPADRGIDAALWFGTPHHSSWRIEVFDRRPAEMPQFEVIEIESAAQLADEQLAVAEAERARAILVSHRDDPVRWAGLDVAVRRPPWLGRPSLRPAEVPRDHRWTPLITVIQLVVDGMNAIEVVPGAFAGNGHDYRADALVVCDHLFGPFGRPGDQLARVDHALRRREVERSERIAAGR